MDERYYDIRNKLAVLKRGSSTEIEGVYVAFDSQGVFITPNCKTTSLKQAVINVMDEVKGLDKCSTHEYALHLVNRDTREITLMQVSIDSDIGSGMLSARRALDKLSNYRGLPPNCTLMSMQLINKE